MPLAGLEPARCYPLDFESSASANSATTAYLNLSDANEFIIFCIQMQQLFSNTESHSEYHRNQM